MTPHTYMPTLPSTLGLNTSFFLLIVLCSHSSDDVVSCLTAAISLGFAALDEVGEEVKQAKLLADLKNEKWEFR